ncbi:Werner syndrome ATP-dependent helicase homolog isoform X2 [Electrophorus electricus]|uniref:Werner syndrome ATP-dependent helicase homolog isoform X2 n=1 Tax=Electrophorus electricus TaxID=8005 RepID=UPI0015CFD8A5|nr:Werner syndrome ATP-dependent helicase homolog isoform X2 [Electrophorus electricus]
MYIEQSAVADPVARCCSVMGDRALPAWMSKEFSQEDVEPQSCCMYKKNILEADLPHLEFTGTVIYSQEKNDCSFLSEDLRSSLAPGSAVGFDLEWPPSFTKGKSKKVALVQLCATEEKCYLFHISSMSGFPPGLKMLLEDENIRKVGVGIEGDKWKLLSDYDVKMKSFVELSDLANDKLKCMEKWSLDGLVKHLFKKKLFKNNDVRCGHWDDFELTQEQKHYAATDAYAGLIIHQKLEKMVNSGTLKAPACLRQELIRISRELVELAGCIPDGLNSISRTQRLVEDISNNVACLRDLLKCTTDMAEVTVEECSSNGSKDRTVYIQNAKTNAMDYEADQKNRNSNLSGEQTVKPFEQDGKPSAEMVQRECVMSLDISEYELQMLEMMAKQEEQEEQSILAFKEKASMENSVDLSYEAESDNELDNEMIQCAEKLEKLDKSADLQPNETQSIAEDEDEDVEEDEEEGFDPNLPQPAPEMIKCLKMYFGHQNFKPVQWKVIQSIFDHRRDNLVVMATGYGKSLCFQFPPVYCKNISIVISPLIALMEDQVMQLRMSNIPACFLGSAQTQNVFADLRKGCFRVVYMTPEFCSGNIPLLHELNDSTGIVLIAVDEAHCISHWGHNFRGVYRDLGKLKRSLPDVPIVALTATASSSIRQDIVKSLHLKNPLVTCTSFDRPNLYLDVTRKTGDIIQDLKPLLVKQTWGDYKFEGAAIVYCPSKKETERVAAALAKLGIRCGVYHAGLSIQKRKDTQYQFMRDEIQCVVATIAFGMGINKPDIRKVIHYGAPKEMESYYQEMGRAGRDGMPSACHVLWLPGDMCLNRFLLIQTVSNKFRGYQMEMMAKMEKYLKSTKCRRKLILSHFEDKQLRKITSGIMGTSKCCDNCKSGSSLGPIGGHLEPTMQDFGPHAFQLMGAVSAMGERFGITAPILLLRGSNSQKVPDRFRQQSLFGAGRGISEAWWRALSRELIFEKYLMESTGCNKFTTLCKLTPKGRSWLSNSQDEKHRTLFLHPNIDLCPRSVSRGNQDLGPCKAGVRDCCLPAPTQSANLSSPIGVASYFRLEPGPSHTSSAKSQPPAVSDREKHLQTELYGKLVVERQKLASIKDVPPAILATNKILLDMAKLRPCTVARLKMVDGVSEAKAAMLSPLLQMVAEFCQAHNLQEVAAELSSATPCPGQTCGTQAAIAFALPLTYNVAVSYRLFQTEGKSLWQVADARSLPVAVVESHLLQAQRANHPLHTERAGLSPSIYNTITRIISSPPLSSNLSDFRSIRALVPEDISTFLIRLCVAKLLAEGVPPRRLPASTPSEDHHLSWIEPQEKPVQVASASTDAPVRPSLLAGEEEPEQGSLEREDELFSEVPMPEDSALPSSSGQACPAERPSGTRPHMAAMELASWNQQNVDHDKQDLFSDSSVKTANQPPKRKLPDWAGSQDDSFHTAAPKITKKKKGLFL